MNLFPRLHASNNFTEAGTPGTIVKQQESNQGPLSREPTLLDLARALNHQLDQNIIFWYRLNNLHWNCFWLISKNFHSQGGQIEKNTSRKFFDLQSYNLKWIQVGIFHRNLHFASNLMAVPRVLPKVQKKAFLLKNVPSVGFDWNFEVFGLLFGHLRTIEATKVRPIEAKLDDHCHWWLKPEQANTFSITRSFFFILLMG